MTIPGPSRIEQAIAHIVATLQPTYAVGGRIWRDRAEALVQAELPALVVYPENSPRMPDTTCRDLWNVLVIVDILVSGGPVSQVADPIWCDVYARLMADQSVGGHASGIEPFPRGEGNVPALQWIRESAENQPGVLSTAWLVRVRTMGADVTQ